MGSERGGGYQSVSALFWVLALGTPNVAKIEAVEVLPGDGMLYG